MPGNNLRAIAKARTLSADGLILDLEDAVAPDGKVAARRSAVEAVAAGGFGGREIFVRINGLDTPWGMDDVRAAAEAKPDAIVVPKVSSPEALRILGGHLSQMGAAPTLRVWAMIETPAAIIRAHEIAAAAADASARLAGFIVGTNDLIKESQGRPVAGRTLLVPWLMQAVAAVRANGLAILDGVYNDFADMQGFEAECRQGRDMGFDGKTLIHPTQVGPCNAVFSPSAEEVAQARRVIAAFAAPENAGKGVVQIDGRMVERMHADIARGVVAVAEAIADREAAASA